MIRTPGMVAGEMTLIAATPSVPGKDDVDDDEVHRRLAPLR